MGFLDKVLGKGDTTLTLAVEHDRLTGGDDVVLRWEVGGELDDKARSIVAGVTATQHWLQRDQDTMDRDRDGNRHDREDHVSKKSSTFWEDTRTSPAALGAGTATITLPPQAAPGSKGVLKWTAWVRVDRERGRDHVEEVTLYVRRPEQADPDTSPAGADGIVVSGLPRALRLGRTYDATVEVTARDDVKGALKAVVVRRVRHVADDGSGTGLGALVETLDMPRLPGTDLLSRAGISERHVIVREEDEAEVVLAESREFAAGRTESFPLRLEVPGRGPTTAHDHAQVDWRVIVKVDRRMRGDLSVEIPVDVS